MVKKNSLQLKTTALMLIAIGLSTAYSENSPIEEKKSNEPLFNNTVGNQREMSESSSDDQDLSMKESQNLIQPLLNFSCSIFDKARSNENNVILSPISIHAALNLLALGAEPKSATDIELRKGLGYQEDASQEQLDQYHIAYKNIIEKFKKISVAGNEALKRAAISDDSIHDGNKPPVVDFYNTIIAKRGMPLFDQYSKRSEEYYRSGVEQIDLGKPETVNKVLDKINQWAKGAGFEQNILNADAFKGDFAAMLISAVRVQAFWFQDFSESDQKAVFHNFGLKDKLVDGKHLYKSDIEGRLVEFCSDDKVKYVKHHSRVKSEAGNDLKELVGLNFRAVEIPLQGKVSFIIFEPLANGQGHELQELAQTLLDGSKLDKVLKILDQSNSKAKFDYVSMPKFGFQNDIDLKISLQSMGINKVFDKSSSELRKIIQGEPVCVDSAKHQAIIDVNKFGLKAAGVTKIRVVPLMAVIRPEPIDIEVRNPFIFMIRYEQIPLFFGQLVKLDK